MTAGPRLTRRTLLGGVSAFALTGAGCTDPPPRTADAINVQRLAESDVFYIAHRGGGGNWPEMTAYAYSEAAKVPNLRALEISVCISSDGVLVCSHDPTTTRMTGRNLVIAENTWATLSTLQVSGQETTAPRQPAQPLTRFDEVVESYIGNFVLFVEAKVPAAASVLLARLVTLGQVERVVWKAPINSRTFRDAKRQGMATWGYVLDEPAHLGRNLSRYAASPDIDMLGAPLSETDAFVRAVSQAAEANQKPTVAWAVRSLADRDRAQRLGCRGMMTANVLAVLNRP